MGTGALKSRVSRITSDAEECLDSSLNVCETRIHCYNLVISYVCPGSVSSHIAMVISRFRSRSAAVCLVWHEARGLRTIKRNMEFKDDSLG